jgi:hypothetical protein
MASLSPERDDLADAPHTWVCLSSRVSSSLPASLSVAS